MFSLRTSLPATASPAAIIALLNREYWPLIASIAPGILRCGWVAGVPDEGHAVIYLMFDGACLNTICALIFRGLQIQPPEALNLSCFVLSAPHWTRSELVAALERRSVVTPVRLEQIAGGEPHRWHLWVHSDVGLKLTLREVYAHCKGAHLRVYGNSELVVRKATGVGIVPPQFGTTPAVQMTRWVKAELEADDEQRKRTALPAETQAELEAELEQTRWDLEVAELKLEHFKHQ